LDNNGENWHHYWLFNSFHGFPILPRAYMKQLIAGIIKRSNRVHKAGETMLHLIISVILYNLVAWFIPKRITRDEMLTTSLFALQLEAEIDIYLDLKYHLYGYFGFGPDWLALVPIYGIFPAANIIYLNYYPYTGTSLRKAVYIGAWSIFSAVYEWSAVYAGWFYYTGWKTWYSVLCYLVIFFLLVKFLDIVKWCKAVKS